jgi:hypothetical protein
MGQGMQLPVQKNCGQMRMGSQEYVSTIDDKWVRVCFIAAFIRLFHHKSLDFMDYPLVMSK